MLKNVIIVIVLLLTITAQSTAQKQCFENENKVVYTQFQLDSLMEGYQDCEIFAGFIILTSNGDDPINNLNAFGNLTYISMAIVDQTSLTDLKGLNNIVEMGYLLIRSNESIESLNGLESLKEISGRFVIQHNSSLKDFSGLSNLQFARDLLDISFNESLTSLKGLESLESVESRLYIGNNPKLNSISELENLSSVNNTTSFVANNSLVEIKGLTNFSFTENLFIGGNPELMTISGMNHLENIGKNIRIWNNNKLQSIEGLSNIDGQEIERFDVFNNTSLSNCHITSICEAIQNNESNTDIFNNAIGCNSTDEILSQCITDVYEISHLPAHVFPNPSVGLATIDLGSERSGRIEVFDLAGRLILNRSHINLRFINLDLSDNKGMNLIRIYDNEGNNELLKHMTIK